MSWGSGRNLFWSCTALIGVLASVALLFLSASADRAWGDDTDDPLAFLSDGSLERGADPDPAKVFAVMVKVQVIRVKVERKTVGAEGAAAVTSGVSGGAGLRSPASSAALTPSPSPSPPPAVAAAAAPMAVTPPLADISAGGAAAVSFSAAPPPDAAKPVLPDLPALPAMHDTIQK